LRDCGGIARVGLRPSLPLPNHSYHVHHHHHNGRVFFQHSSTSYYVFCIKFIDRLYKFHSVFLFLLTSSFYSLPRAVGLFVMKGLHVVSEPTCRTGPVQKPKHTSWAYHSYGLRCLLAIKRNGLG